MKLIVLFLVLVAAMSTGFGQNTTTPTKDGPDTNAVWRLIDSSNIYSFYRTDTGMALAQQALNLARSIGFKRGEVEALETEGEAFHFMGDFPNALRMQFQALELGREIKDRVLEAETLGFIGIVYNELGQYRQALQYLVPALGIYSGLPGRFDGSFILSNMGDSYHFMNMPDSALYYQRMAYEKFSDPSRSHLKSFILQHMGSLYAEAGKKDSALRFYYSGLFNSIRFNDKLNLSMIQKKMADLYRATLQYDSSLYYARLAFQNAKAVPLKLQMLQASTLLAMLFHEHKNSDSAFFYSDVASAMRDSIYGPDKYRQLQLLLLQEQQRQQTIIHQAEQYRNRIKYTALIAILIIFLLLAFILIRNNRRKQKANELLSKQKKIIEETLSELKSAQAQLIQREKMASLGELTAGIAHEIQNPLNFVNNFSEVNKELLAEMKDEITKGNLDEAKAIADDIIDNEIKINHHGSRADAIVKGMLQHSRSSTAAKEPANINALADEYSRLAYHGFRAKDKNFNTVPIAIRIKTDFDESIGNINIVAQEIGRVLLNLYNNAFYAVNEKQKTAGEHYEPTVAVTTRKINEHMELTVKDNGNGIPASIVDKIFQPFFTTKPTGQGTGLGLSLSYDIIKAHGGELQVRTKEGEGSKFIVRLPFD
jgi:two-component system, NtrC family, sensor kinase